MTFLTTLIAAALGNLLVLAFLCLCAWKAPSSPDDDEDDFGRTLP